MIMPDDFPNRGLRFERNIFGLFLHQRPRLGATAWRPQRGDNASGEHARQESGHKRFISFRKSGGIHHYHHHEWYVTTFYAITGNRC
jgi:hypothetical protein